jgi:hypothetical protein
VKGTTPPDSTLTEPPALYPNPASVFINAILPDEVSGEVNVRIISQSGQIVINYNTGISGNVPVRIDISRLSSGTYSAVFTNSKKNTSCRGRFIVIK